MVMRWGDDKAVPHLMTHSTLGKDSDQPGAAEISLHLFSTETRILRQPE